MNKRTIPLIITFLVIMTWVIFSVLHDRACVKISPKLQNNLSSIDPNFDIATLNLVSQVQIPSLPSAGSSPSPSPLPSPASASANISSGSASPSP